MIRVFPYTKYQIFKLQPLKIGLKDKKEGKCVFETTDTVKIASVA